MSTPNLSYLHARPVPHQEGNLIAALVHCIESCKAITVSVPEPRTPYGTMYHEACQGEQEHLLMMHKSVQHGEKST